MEHLKMHSMNKIDENVSKIAQLFPNCVTEAKEDNGEIVHKIDFDMLKQELSNTLVEGREERYQFTWPDKKKAILTANAPINKTLRPCREESVDFDNTQNLYIEGDNLEALKLLQETYLGKIKMIYIDPPYNTGNDFVYNDDFSQDAVDFKEHSGQLDDDGNYLLDNYTRNIETNGRFHTDWLNMIYSRVKLSRDLLTEDGVILISIDDSEISNLIKITNEIFGEKNRISNLIWNCSTAGGIRPKHISKTHEYILVYAKNIECIPTLWAPLSSDAQKMYTEKDSKGLYRNKEFVFKNSSTNINQKYEITCPDGEKVKPKEGYIYRFVPETFEEAKKNDLVVFKKTDNSTTLSTIDGKPAHWNIFIKKYFGDGLGCPSTSLPKDLTGMYNKGTQDVQVLFDDKRVFENVKPTTLIQYLTQIFSNKDNFILDFFSGSGTTANAIMQLNAEDEGLRKFIMVQIPELTDEKSEAYKSGFKNICEIGKERIRRAGKKIIEEHPECKDKLDIGFRVLKIDSSNMEDVYYTPDHIDTNDLFKNNIKSDRTGEDLLFQTMLDLGIMLSSKIETKKINGKEVFCVEGNYLMACFDDTVDEATITEIAKERPYYFVMRDPANSKDGDSLITNFEQIFATYSPDTVRKVL